MPEDSVSLAEENEADSTLRGRIENAAGVFVALGLLKKHLRNERPRMGQTTTVADNGPSRPEKDTDSMAVAGGESIEKAAGVFVAVTHAGMGAPRMASTRR